MAIHLQNLSLAPKTFYKTKWGEWKVREKKKRKSNSGPGYYVKMANRLGAQHISVVFEALDRGRLNQLDAYEMLDVQAANFDKLRAEIFESDGQWMDGADKRYIVDASSWIMVENHPAQNRILFCVGKLIESGKIQCPPEAWGEVKFCPWVLAWLEPLKDEFVQNISATEYLMMVGKVTHKFPAMAGARRPKDKGRSIYRGYCDVSQCDVKSD